MTFLLGILVGLIPFMLLVWHQIALPEIYFDNVVDVDVEEYMKDKIITD